MRSWTVAHADAARLILHRTGAGMSGTCGPRLRAMLRTPRTRLIVLVLAAHQAVVHLLTGPVLPEFISGLSICDVTN